VELAEIFRSYKDRTPSGVATEKKNNFQKGVWRHARPSRVKFARGNGRDYTENIEQLGQIADGAMKIREGLWRTQNFQGESLKGKKKNRELDLETKTNLRLAKMRRRN